jgi:hypothetical protein
MAACAALVQSKYPSKWEERSSLLEPKFPHLLELVDPAEVRAEINKRHFK